MNDLGRIGFYVRNGFEVIHFRSLFREIEGAVWVGRSKKRLSACGVKSNEPYAVSRFFLRRVMKANFDIIIATGGLPGGRPLTSPKLVMLQYGYAKEPYNYGPWRSAADLILAYGEYAQRRFSKHADSVVIGNPRWDEWIDPDFQQSVKESIEPLLDSEKKTVLYAPTWGDLSSLPDWLDEITALSHSYNVLFKPHHNSIRDGQISMHNNSGVITLPDEDLFKLISVADVVISDISGAIFDAVLCKKPVVLVCSQNIEKKFGKKLDYQSIEIFQRKEFGTIVKEKTKLFDTIKLAIQHGPKVSQAWRDDLFETKGTVISRFKNAISQLNPEK